METRRTIRQRRTARYNMLVLTAALFAFLLLAYGLEAAGGL